MAFRNPLITVQTNPMSGYKDAGPDVSPYLWIKWWRILLTVPLALCLLGLCSCYFFSSESPSSAGLWDGLISHSQGGESEHQTYRASYLECGPQTSSMALPGAFSQVTLRLTWIETQILPLNQSPRWFLCPLKSEKHPMFCELPKWGL